MKYIRFSTKKFLLFSFLFLLVLVVQIISAKVKKSVKNFDEIPLDKGWDFTINDQINKNVTLSSFIFVNTNRGDKLVLERILPDKTIKNPAVIMHLYHCVVEAYCDGELIYEHDRDEYDNGNAVGNGNHVISLPNDYEGKKVKIVLTVSENEAFPNIEPLSLVNEQDYVTKLMRVNLLEISSAMFLSFFGFVFIFISLIFGQFKGEYRKLFWMGCIAFVFSIWALSNYNFMELIMPSKRIVMYYEYLGLYLSPPSILMFLFESNKNKIWKKISLVTFYVYITGIIITVICNELNIYHISVILKWFHLFSLIIILISFSYIFIDYKKKAKSEKTLINGIFFIVILCIIEIFRFNIVKYFPTSEVYTSLLPVSITIFIFIMLMSYFEFLKEYISEKSEEKTLEKMAYCDTLTGLYNRVKCEKYMNEMQRKGDKEYAILSFDLNNLKMINDTMGHIRGDNYICEFSNLLKKYFEGSELIGRMGGDEFIVISRTTERMKLIKIIVDFINDSKKIENPNIGLQLSFAYGYVISTKERILNVWKAYEEADNRMYECKRRQKEDSKNGV